MPGMLCYPLDGAYSQVDEQNTAFSGGRPPRFGVFIAGMATGSEVSVAGRIWAQNFWEALRPHAIGSGG